MKVCVTIPAYNEEDTVGAVVRECGEVLEEEGHEHEILVVDDGSSDGTVEAAEDAGAMVYSHHTNRGLGNSFATAMREVVRYDPDVIVNIDADGQYEPEEMPELIGPVASGEADMVIGTRSVLSLDHMPMSKRVGNKIGSFVTSILAERRLKDAQSGYRAFTPELAARWTLFGSYTYVQESLIQASHRGFRIEEVPISFYERESGNSRLIASLTDYIRNAARIVIRTYRDHKPMRTFSIIAFLFFLLASFPAYQVMNNFLSTGSFDLVGRGLLVVILALGGALTLVFGLLADMLKGQRELMEEILHELRSAEE